jgi:hypothetical protein
MIDEPTRKLGPDAIQLQGFYQYRIKTFVADWNRTYSVYGMDDWESDKRGKDE